jgi:hypothetical protein
MSNVHPAANKILNRIRYSCMPQTRKASSHFGRDWELNIYVITKQINKKSKKDCTKIREFVDREFETVFG